MQVALYLAGEITQVKEAIPWVRCASGNVYYKSGLHPGGLRVCLTPICTNLKWLLLSEFGGLNTAQSFRYLIDKAMQKGLNLKLLKA